MEKRINKRIETYVSAFKDNIRNKIIELQIADKSKINDLLEFVYEYNRLTLQKDDFVKRKRLKNAIPLLNRCNAKRANGEQCTRRRRDDCEYCGTHYKGTPHGTVCEEVGNPDTLANQRMEVVAEDIGGIVYYIDRYGNVYHTEDILRECNNPRIIAKYVKVGNRCTIPEFGLV